MEEPQYEYGPLVKGIERCDKNIEAMREAIKKEEELKAEMLYWKKRHEEYREWLKE